MRAVIQCVRKADVSVDGGEPRAIGPGIVVLLGVKDTDTLDIVPKLAEKCANLRVFPDEEGKLNKSAVDLGYSALVVSNFTLYGDTKKGKRPSYVAAAKPPLSVDAYELFLAEMEKQGLKEVKHGEFGADMLVNIANDGPVTIVIDTDRW
ncbi:MAG TPA: D-tyrosyl-tRNA(Tyr) deacylase [Candidatus Fournierella merdigallinarum]|nr:D-tyrosyl-tRNA(Tyr) deacylase [Candidatus Fournierella merdigallinarum]